MNSIFVFFVLTTLIKTNVGCDAFSPICYYSDPHYLHHSSIGRSPKSSSFAKTQNLQFSFSNHERITFRRRTSPMKMGLEVKIRIVGRKNGGEPWLESSYSTYEKRLKPTNLQVTTQWHKNDDDLVKAVEGDEAKNHPVVLLDPLGKMCTSEKFCDGMYKWLEEGGSRLTFVIGGAEGLPEELRGVGARRRNLLSLSSLTFTHQFARILLMEQIYRASEIRKGSGYHK
mmetsp:Transcript_22767/g.46290  ORF Transcript_22767/g.46290 Transcript_22767/m.46290 type:complete len:228 (-) Transcript_22767:186-869(-)